MQEHALRTGMRTWSDAELWHWKPNGTDGEWRMSVTSCKLCSMFHSNSHNLSNRKVKTLPSVRFLLAHSLFNLYPIQTLLNIHRLDRGEFFGRDFGAGQSAIYFLETAKGGPKFSWATSCGTIHLLAVGEKQGWPQSGRYETISWHCGLGMGGKASTVGPWYHNPLARKHWQSSLSLKAVGQALVAVLGWNQLQGTRFIGATAAAPKFAVLIWPWERYTMRSWVNTQVSLARWKVWGVGIMQGPVRWSLLP